MLTWLVFISQGQFVCLYVCVCQILVLSVELVKEHTVLHTKVCIRAPLNYTDQRHHGWRVHEFGPLTDCGPTEVKLHYNSSSPNDACVCVCLGGGACLDLYGQLLFMRRTSFSKVLVFMCHFVNTATANSSSCIYDICGSHGWKTRRWLFLPDLTQHLEMRGVLFIHQQLEKSFSNVKKTTKQHPPNKTHRVQFEHFVSKRHHEL